MICGMLNEFYDLTFYQISVFKEFTKLCLPLCLCFQSQVLPSPKHIQILQSRFLSSFTMIMKNHMTLFFVSLSLLLPVVVSRNCTCDMEENAQGNNKTEARNLKIIAFVCILLFSAIGVSIPVVSKIFPACQPGNNIFFIIKAFAAGVILATGFIHILPDAFDHLTSPCLKENPWGNFPFTGFMAMMAAITTLMIETIATSYFKRMQYLSEALPVNGDEEKAGEHAVHVHVHTQSTHGSIKSGPVDHMRHRVISQVLELGIIVHSVIIGISLGTSESPSTIKPLVVALCFHQFFEGIGLGGCIFQANFKNKAVIIMALFFSLTTPVGIAIGMVISKGYKENSPTALIVEGILNSASAGILVYMALVDLLAVDFMSSKVQSNGKLQFLAYLSLLGGAGLMSLLAKWA